MPRNTSIQAERHPLEVCLGVHFLDDENKSGTGRVFSGLRNFLRRRRVMKTELLPPGEDYVPPVPAGTTLHARPQETPDGDRSIEPEMPLYDDGEVYE